MKVFFFLIPVDKDPEQRTPECISKHPELREAFYSLTPPRPLAASPRPVPASRRPARATPCGPRLGPCGQRVPRAGMAEGKPWKAGVSEVSRLHCFSLLKALLSLFQARFWPLSPSVHQAFAQPTAVVRIQRQICY